MNAREFAPVAKFRRNDAARNQFPALVWQARANLEPLREEYSLPDVGDGRRSWPAEKRDGV